MPEIKHNFTGGKMNKDLDERLVPNGQYRDAMNIQVSTSEESDVGTAQNILGNSLVDGQDFIPQGATCVGSISDEKNDKLYYFVDTSNYIIKNTEIINSDFWQGNNVDQDFSGDGVLLTSIPDGSTTPNYQARFIQSFDLIDGETYELNIEFDDIDNAGDGLKTKFFVRGSAVSAYRPISGTEVINPGNYTDTFTFDKNQNNGSTSMRLDIEMVNGLTFEKTIRIKKATLISKSGIIIEYDSTKDLITPVLVDKKGILNFNKNRIITGINIIDDILLFTDGHSEPKKINITRSIKGTDPSGTIHTKLINESIDINILSGVDLQEEHITVIRKSPKTAPIIELSSQQNPNATNGGVITITTDPGNLTPGGANPQNASSFIGSSNQYYDFSQFLIGSQFSTRIETDLQGNSGFTLSWNNGDTVLIKEFGGNNYDEVPPLPITNYSIKAKVINVINPTDDITEFAPNNDFTLPNTDGSKPLGYKWSHNNITYDSLNSKIIFNNVGSYNKVYSSEDINWATGGVYRIRYEVQNIISGIHRFFISKTINGIQYRWQTSITNATNVDVTLTLDATTGSTYSNNAYNNKFVIESGGASNNSFEILNLSIERQDVQDAEVELEITGFEGVPLTVPQNFNELKYAVEKLNEEEKLFEYKFPRFAYRYQYEDKEYSTFSPFTQIAFLPGSFDYHPRNAYNLGMVNNVNEIKLSGFIPSQRQDVVAVDILYKDEGSSNVYVVDTIKNNQYNSDIWTKDEYIVKSETIKRTLPSNQLLRPWDSVPKTALAQEISGNRVVYANYTQGFDLIKQNTNKEYYANLAVSLSSVYEGLNTVKSIKSLREYQLGVVFIDEYGRETPVLSSSTASKKITKKDSNKSNKLEVTFSDQMFPKDMKYFKFFVKETSGEYYNMSMDRWWDAEDGLAWISFPSSDINKINIDTFLILKKGVGSNILVEDKARYKVLAIETEAPDHIKTNKILLEEKTHIFTSTDDSLFGGTINNAPLFGKNVFQINYAPFQDSPGSELHNIEDGILYIEFAIGGSTSDRYRITELSQPAANINVAKYNIKIDKNFGDDINFICDDPLSPTRIVDNTVVRIYKYVIENTSEFDGRFFVKVNRDDVFDTNVYSETIGSIRYRTTVSKKLYYMGGDQHKLHHPAFTGQSHGIYNDPLTIVTNTSGSQSNTYDGGGSNNNLTFGSFAPFFRNYRFDSDSESTSFSTISPGTTHNIGQYKFDDTDESKWKAEAAFYTFACPPSPGFSNQFPPDNGLKNADDSSFNETERYGVFNAKGEQEKGNVWFIDGGPYSGQRTGSTSLHWPFIHSTNGVEQGVVEGNENSSMLIAIGGIYHDKECNGTNTSGGSDRIDDFFNIGSNNGNSYYDTQQFRDLVKKISPSVKFRFREDPTGEIYTIQPSGVSFNQRLRWSDGDIMTNTQTDEFPAWTSVNAQATQLSPNFTMGYKTTFKNDSTDDGSISWDPTNNGNTGPIPGGLKLQVNAGNYPLTISSNQVFVSDVHNIACDNNGGEHSITVGMILTSYGSFNLDGSFSNPHPISVNANYSYESLIVSKIQDVNNGYVLTLVGYTSLLKASSGSVNIGGIDRKQHKIYHVTIATGDTLVFQQPAMNGYSQYSVNRINAQDTTFGGSGGWSTANPGLLAVGYNIEFIEEINLESEFPSNPAIWETEPKESTDLDVYYEASSYNPLELTDETRYLAIPLGSLVECVENPAATLVENEDMIVYRVKNIPLPDTLLNGMEGEGQWALSISSTVTQQSPLVNDAASFISIGDHLKITKPDGSIITVKVTGWDASIGFTGYPTRTALIYIDEVLHGPNTKYTLGWHNCYSFGNGVESNRIRDTFNLPFIANGVKVSTTLDENPYEEHLKYGLIYSGIYNSNSGINNLNQFIAAEKITKDINPIYGSIQKLKAGWGQGGDLITLCEDRILKILANKDALFNADGNTNLTSTNNVLGEAIPYSGEYGISTNPESFVSEAYRAYFTDRVRGAVMRLSMDGLTPISEAGMKDFFRDNLRLENKIIGSYDDRQDEYNLTLPNSGQTITYKEDVRGWVSFKSFIKENGVSCANDYYTFQEGKMWKHHNENVDRNTFYNNFTNSSVNVILNDAPSSIKSYYTLEYEGSQSRVAQNLEDNEYYNLTDKDGWYVSGIETNKKKGSLLEFIEKEGKWFNYIKGIESNIDETTDFASFDIQGLGIVEGVNNRKITIDGDLNVSLQIKDTIYVNSTQIEIVGKVTAINNNTITVDDSGTLPLQNDYIFFVKNQVVNMSGLSGYYAEAKFENDSKIKAELYAVSSEVSESSK